MIWLRLSGGWLIFKSCISVIGSTKNIRQEKEIVWRIKSNITIYFLFNLDMTETDKHGFYLLLILFNNIQNCFMLVEGTSHRLYLHFQKIKNQKTKKNKKNKSKKNSAKIDQLTDSVWSLSLNNSIHGISLLFIAINQDRLVCWLCFPKPLQQVADSNERRIALNFTPLFTFFHSHYFMSIACFFPHLNTV